MKSLSPHLIKGQKTDSLAEINSKFPTTVAIVEDDENDCRLMIQALKMSHDFVFVGVCRSAEEALVAIPNIRPHLVLMDLRLPGMDGHECARRLRIIVPRLKIVFITGLLDLDTMYKSVRTGADGYLTKPTSAAQFLAVLEKAVESMPATEKASVISSRNFDTPKACSFLTVRENQVMTLLAKGFPYKLIADQLSISFSAVNQHLNKIYRKLDASNRTEAVNQWWDGSPVG